MGIDIPLLLIVLGVILFSMTLHEAMHGFVAYWLGDDTAKREGRLTLNPIKHIDPFLTIILPLGLALVGGPIFGGAKPVPFRPDQVKGGDWGAALVALGGPLTNLFIAFIAFGIWVVSDVPPGSIATTIFSALVSVNLGFFVFNMLPIPPLDGSRVLYALAPEFVRTGMRAIEQFGIIFILILVLLAGSLLGAYMSEAIHFFLLLFQTIFRV
ncbi:zinc metalloprotease ywhC [Candidatus Saccharibacteria bacterium 47-87]|jgi:Zn-dependent protease|nr:site-2 protease family protein [Candidatus Saccharibacteria bacterium]OJU96712.1 MAG: zinc metalloprotease ywhC [Candidatus Saccharibacteria bacterium 47-87]